MSSNDDSSSTDMESEDDVSANASYHGHLKRFSLVEISTRNLVKKIMNFETRCLEMPSSWVVEIQVEKGFLFENFTISITLKRNDSRQTPIEGFVRVFLSNFEDKICPIGYNVKHELPYFELLESSGIREVRERFLVSGHYKCLFIEDRESFLHDMLLVKAQLVVSGCCGSDKLNQDCYLRNE